MHIYISAIVLSIIIKSSLGAYNFESETLDKYSFLLIQWNISNLSNFLMLIGIGFTGITGFLCLFGAYNIGSPSAIAPLRICNNFVGYFNQLVCVGRNTKYKSLYWIVIYNYSWNVHII